MKSAVRVVGAPNVWGLGVRGLLKMRKRQTIVLKRRYVLGKDRRAAGPGRYYKVTTMISNDLYVYY